MDNHQGNGKPVPDDVDLEGWTRRSTLDEPRLSEVVELYRELGFEVLLRPPSRDELGEECSECYFAEGARFMTVYTRPGDVGS